MTDLATDLATLARAQLARATQAELSDDALIGLAIRLAETQDTLSPAARPRRWLVFCHDDSGTKRPGIEKDRRTIGPAEESVVIAVPEAGDTQPPGSRESIGCFATAISAGARAVGDAGEQGVRVIALPAPQAPIEPALALIAFLAPASAAAVLSPSRMESETIGAAQVRALEERVRRADAMADRIAALASLCPPELAAMAGAIVEARRLPLTVVVDSVAAAAAALVAFQIDASSPDGLIPAGPIGLPACDLAWRALCIDPVRVGDTDEGAMLRLLQRLDEAAALFAPAPSAPPGA